MKRLGGGIIRFVSRLQYSVAILSLLLAMVSPASPVRADSVCQANITPGTVQTGGTHNFNVNIINSGGPRFNWVNVTVPSSNFSYIGNDVNGWWSFDHAGGATFYGGAINNGSSSSFSITAQVGPGTSPGETWSVQVADNTSGDNPITCEGSLTTVIEGPSSGGGGATINTVATSDITHNSATVMWYTNNPSSSAVYYGTTSGYGSSTQPNLNQVNSHSVTLTGLSSNTTYHFQVAGFEGNGTFVYSPDGTFMTLPAPVNPTPNPNPTPTPLPAVQNNQVPVGAPRGIATISSSATSDKTAPTLTIATKLVAAYKTPPIISGSATDDVAVDLVEYSLDNGKNWLPAEVMAGQKTKSLTFSLRLPPLQDGNYDLVIRSVDTSGNMYTARAQELVIDQLPPIVGGSVMAVGPQVIYPDAEGIVTALEGADQRLTMSAVGGPIAITLSAVPTDAKLASNLFSLRKSPDSGLWVGALNFSNSGEFDIAARALDGAGNITNRRLFRLRVLPRAPVLELGTNKTIDATVTAYYRDPETGTWVQWDAEAYGQQNPQRTTKDKNYGFYMPTGTYYLRYDAPGYRAVVSRTVTLDKPTALTQDMYLAPNPGIRLGKYRLTIPWISLSQTDYSQSVTSKAQPAQTAALPKVPNFRLSQTNQQPLTYPELWGKLTVLTLLNSWAPASQDQLQILNTVSHPDVRVLPVMSGDSQSRATVYTRLSGYPASILVDSTNQLAQSMELSIVPTHYFLDRHGLVKKVMVGVLSKEELLQNAQH